MSLSVPGLGVRKQRVRTDKEDCVIVSAWFGGEVAESGTNKADYVTGCACSGGEVADSGKI